MRCEDIENDIAEYLAGRLPGDSALVEHLRACPRCRQEVEELRNVWAELGEMPVPRSAPGSSPVMQPGLVQALAEAKQELIKRRKPMPYFAKVTLLILVSAVSSLFVRHRLEQPSYAPAGPARVTMVTTGNPSNPDGAHYRGAPDVPITLVEYGDYACPPCAAYNTVINEVLQKYGDKIRLEYRHFPLTVPHPNALPASLAAEAAGRQGRYWEMHDLLFSSQQRWKNAANPEGEFAGLAESLGLDGKRFIEAFRSKELEERVRKDMRAGQELHVSAVPAFVINGRVIPEMLPTLERFKALIDAETAKRN